MEEEGRPALLSRFQVKFKAIIPVVRPSTTQVCLCVCGGGGGGGYVTDHIFL